MTEANRTEDLSVVKPFGASKPAHPAVEIRYSTGPGSVATTKVFHTGLTKRELIAAMAMQGAIASGQLRGPSDCVSYAMQCADTLLKELAK